MLGKRRRTSELIESKIFEFDKKLKKNLAKGTKLGDIVIEDIKRNELANLVYYIISKGKLFIKIYVDIIKYFLSKYTKYSGFEGDKDFFLRKLSMSMNAEKHPKNRIIFRKNDIGDRFYLILRGSVSVVIVKERYELLTPREYNIYLERLILYKEYQLIKLVFTYPNKIQADINLLEKIHRDILSQSEILNEDNNNIESISANDFVQRIEPIINYKIMEERVKVRIATYQIVATLKEGQTFGEIALSRNEKEERRRTATIITDTECLMGTILTSLHFFQFIPF